MAITALRGKTCHTNGELPANGQTAPDFCAINTRLEQVCLAQLPKPFKLIYTVPSLDTQVCAETSKQLNTLAAELNDVHCLVISADLPFAQQRFLKENKLKNLTTLSLMQTKKMAQDYGVLLIDGPLQGLTARAVFVLDADNRVSYSQLCEDITREPDFSLAIEQIKAKASEAC